jgi:hypothetical protein
MTISEKYNPAREAINTQVTNLEIAESSRRNNQTRHYDFRAQLAQTTINKTYKPTD